MDSELADDCAKLNFQLPKKTKNKQKNYQEAINFQRNQSKRQVSSRAWNVESGSLGFSFLKNLLVTTRTQACFATSAFAALQH